jgi:hypothetical protein
MYGGENDLLKQGLKQGEIFTINISHAIKKYLTQQSNGKITQKLCCTCFKIETAVADFITGGLKDSTGLGYKSKNLFLQLFQQ